MSFNEALGLSAEDVRVLEQVRTRFHPLVYNLDQLLAEMAANMEAPPSWNTVLRHSALAKSHLRSIFEYFNEPVTRDGDHILTADGKEVTVSDVLASLNPYPISPFPTLERNEMLQKILAKKLGPQDEAYVDARISEAANFCRVPEDWGIVPSKKTQFEDVDPEDSGTARREVTNLGEEETRNTWNLAGHAVATEYVFFEKVVKGNEDADYDSDDEEATRIKQVRKELHLETDSAESSPAPAADAQAQPTEQAPLPFEVLLKFASRGVVDVTPRAMA